MKLWSDGWANGDAIPERFAAGKLGADGVGFSDNLSPHLAWTGLPAGTQSLVLVCHDFDVPRRGDDVNTPDREVFEEFASYDMLALPVLDDAGRLLGAVSVDDVVDRMLGSGWRQRSRRRRDATRSAVAT